ncbi:MAG TPA: [protein-PII] uridylyltransferase [Blastocatellia bacterium]|nr:[protein-PII] uridylyltransferase [Blastocatellia bacterium]
MLINFETIERHTGEKLRRIEQHSATADRIIALKKFLKIETQRLHLRHRFGIGGAPIVAARNLIVDMLIQHMASTVAMEKGFNEREPEEFAIIALGGYGRQELAPHSDIDLLFLHGHWSSERANEMSEAILYLLWDAGLSVGHSCRSLSECLTIAKEDEVSRNALMDARLLWGNRGLFETLTQKLNDSVLSKDRRGILKGLMEERAARYAKFGSTPCLQEPNVKESAGGLRDFHTLLWVTRVAYGYSTLTELVANDIIPERDAKAIRAAYDFLLRVRNDLHFITSRRTDQLTLDLQMQVAHDLGYKDSPEQQASEIFMRDYFLHARRLHRLCAAHEQRAVARQEKTRWLSRWRQASAIGGFVMRDGALDLDEKSSDWDASRLLLAFSYAQATGASFSPDLQDRIQENLPLINRAFRSSTDAAQAFLKMLRVRGKASAALRQMHDLGFLGKYLPEFGRVTCLVQHDLYHKFTVDEHTLRAIEILDELAYSRSKTLERYRQLYSAVKDPSVLYLALLMHDIGKGLGGEHTQKGLVIAERICNRLHLEETTKEQILFLIRQHLTMSHISQRRDLSDEKVIQTFAEQVGTVENLTLLTLLTYADVNAVGSGVWNEWKDALLWELYQKTHEVLDPNPNTDDSIEKLRNHIALMLASEIGVDEVREHFKQLTDDYARQTSPQTIIEHIRLAHALNSRLIRTGWRVNQQARCTDLHVCARNRRGLFAAIAGTLTAQGVNILSVHLNTRADGLAIDTFKVTDTVGEPITDPVRWEQIDSELKRALAGEVDVEAAVAKRLKANSARTRRKSRSGLFGAHLTTRVNWDNESSDRSTILEIRTSDRLGLVYRISSTLAALNIDIGFAKVATEKHLALDVFYLTDASGAKLADEQLPATEAEIRKALGGDEV